MKSESIKELTAALAKAQKVFKPIKRTEKVGYETGKGRKQYNYAPLNEVIEATKQALSDNELAVTQLPVVIDGVTYLETLLSHSSGEWVSSMLYVGVQNELPQSEGSALTYKRRYGLSAILNVSSEEDDDGATAQEAKPEAKPKIEKKETATTDGITEAQTKKIYAMVNEKDIAIPKVKAYLKSTFNRTSSKELTKDEACRLIEALESGIIKEVQQSKLIEAAIAKGAEEIPEGGK